MSIIMQDDINKFFAVPSNSKIISLKAQQITAPMVAGAKITIQEMSMGGGVRIVVHVIDRSPSMKVAKKLMLDGFGEYYMKAIKEARQDDISVLRLAGLSFSSDITPIWGKPGPEGLEFFHPLDELPPLTGAEYNPAKGWGTALHAALLEGYTRALAYAKTIMDTTGIQPEIDILGLTDGANNEEPAASVVRDVVVGSRKDLVRFVLLFFETQIGLKQAEFERYATQDLGIDGENIMFFGKQPNETEQEHRQRFRRMLRVMSRISASKGTSAVKAVQAITQSAVVQDDDEDLI